ncbi:MAG: redoxin family protein [Chitinophagaceae bacterium]|nr:redoxin family protein [Chitinophagaceae bacterium]
MKKIFYFILFVIIINNKLSAQKNTIIQGKIWAAPNDTINVFIYPMVFGHESLGGTVQRITTSDGSFQVKVPNQTNPFYCTITTKRLGNLLLSDLLIEPGDSLIIESNVSMQELALKKSAPPIKISGRNADKNQAQHFLRFIDRYGTTPIILNRYYNLKDAYSDIEGNYIIKKRYLDSLLNLPNISINPAVREELKFNLDLQKVGSLISVFRSISEKMISKKDSLMAYNQLKEDYQLFVKLPMQTMIVDQRFKFISPLFLEVAIIKTIVETKIKKGTFDRIPAVAFLPQLEQWPAACRQEVATYLATELILGGSNVSDLPEMFTALTPWIKKPLLKAAIEQYQKTYAVGVSVFPFELIGVDGKKQSIAAFKEKTVVLDFWFTGCRPCMGMSKFLKKVKDKIGNNNNIVFMSICVDEDRDRWLKSVEEEEYTHKDFVNLYTNGEGREHPLIKHYNVSSYPRVMIIGKNNVLLETNPPRSDSPTNVDDFIAALLKFTN